MHSRWVYGPISVRTAAVCSVLVLFGAFSTVLGESDRIVHPTVGPPRVISPRPSINPPTLLPSAHGDWRQWRGNPQHTGYQGLPGRISTPSIRWRHRLGGRVKQEQAVLCSSGGVDQLLVAPSGRLSAFSLDGVRLWQRQMSFDVTLFGCWDLAGDGHAQIVAASGRTSGAVLYVLDAKNGSVLWTSPTSPGSAGAVKVLQLDSTPALELLWLPASSSIVRAYSFASGAARPTLLWSSEIEDFVSDPYTFSSIGVAGSGSSERRVVISGARHQIPTIVLDAADGREISRATVPPAGLSVESGGYGQLFHLKDIGGTAGQRLINVASYSSSSQYMFQGLMSIPVDRLEGMQVLDTAPVGLRYVRGSVDSFTPGGPTQVLVSKYDADASRNDLILFSAADLTPTTTLRNFYLAGIADLGDRQGPFVIGMSGTTDEVPASGGPLIALRYNGTEFRQLDWFPGMGTLASPLTRSFNDAGVDNAGDTVSVLKGTGGAANAILLYRRPDQIEAVDVAGGRAVGSYERTGAVLTLLAVRQDPSPAKERVVVAGDDGVMVFLDGSLNPVATVPVGGYYRNPAINGHTFEVAALADLDGNGINELVAVDSQNLIRKLSSIASKEPPVETLLWGSGTPQELMALPWSKGGSRLVVESWDAAGPRLSLLDSAGRVEWSRSVPAGDDLPMGLNFGRFSGSGQPDLVFSCGNNASFPRATCAWNGSTGASLWRSSVGTYWDATLAVWDFDQDGIDDVVFDYNVNKAAVVSGRSGQQLSAAVSLPDYGDLEAVDYNGAPIVVGAIPGGTAVVNAQDDAHLALIAVPSTADSSSGALVGGPVWSNPQSQPDDQRYSMPAIAPDAVFGWLIGVGGQSGVIRVVAPEGRTVWSAALWNGQVLSEPPAHQNSLSSVLALDVRGNGRVAFVVGGADGWLYALDAGTGVLVWGLDLGAPLGDPIAGDIEGSGFSDILVPAADGNLYAIGDASR